MTTRTCYTLDGVAVALRVTGDPDVGDGLYYLHGDHPGSLSQMTDSSGALVADSIARFLPFGEYRSDGSGPVDGNDLSDRGFTGHYENREVGLTYMQARYYAPELRRFISADTIVPDPGASIGYNRFAYVGQNPLSSIDPTGHFTEEAIHNYLLDVECHGDPVCADYTLEQWQQNASWWYMLRAAEAGDTLYGYLGWYREGQGNTYWFAFYWIFQGEGQNSLTGLSGYYPGGPEREYPTLNDASVGYREFARYSTGGHYSVDWYGVYRGASPSAVPVYLRPSRTYVTVGPRYAVYPEGSIMADVSVGVAMEGIETVLCNAVNGAVPGAGSACSFVFAGVTSLPYGTGGAIPHPPGGPDQVLVNGPMAYFYRFKNCSDSFAASGLSVTVACDRAIYGSFGNGK